MVCQMTCQRSLHLLVCTVLTQCFCFACSVCFGSFKNLILAGFVRDQLVLLSFKRTTVHINLLEYFCFLEIDVCVYPRYLTFDIHEFVI